MSEGAGQGPDRRGLLKGFAIGGAVVGLMVHAVAWALSLVPNVLREPPTRRPIGEPGRFPEGHTYLADEKIFVIREKDRVRALSAICTHLGCTVGVQNEGYHCPCHGSTFAEDGAATGGPAPRALPWHPVELGGGGMLVVDLGQEVGPEEALVLEAKERKPKADGAKGEPK